jgi:hypothetical protein
MNQPPRLPRSDGQLSLGDPLHDVRVAMVKEAARPGVQSGDCGHLLRGEYEVEHIEILDHPLRADGLRNRHDSTLYEPPEDHLSDRLSVGTRDGAQGRIGEDVVPTLRERSPRFDLDPVLLQEFLGLDLLKER